MRRLARWGEGEGGSSQVTGGPCGPAASSQQQPWGPLSAGQPLTEGQEVLLFSQAHRRHKTFLLSLMWPVLGNQPRGNIPEPQADTTN